MPGKFLPAWEADPAMAQVDRWVIQHAVKQISDWCEQGFQLNIGVNISTWLLHDEGLFDEVQQQLHTYPQARGLLELEVTETRALHDIEYVSHVMEKCAEEAVAFSLDDFGTGFSSLVHLQRLPARGIKIDTSFVIGMLDNQKDYNLVKGIIGIANGLGKEVVAEGVETSAHGDALLALNCVRAQGYGIAKPMPASRFIDWINEYEVPASWRTTNPVALKAI